MVAVTPGGAQGALAPSPIEEVPVGQPGMGSGSGGEGPRGLPRPCLTIQRSSHLLHVGEAVVAFQSGGDADGSIHAQGVFLQATGGGRVRKHRPGRRGHQEGMHAVGVGIGKSHQLRGLPHRELLAWLSPHCSLQEGLERLFFLAHPRERDTYLRRRRLRFTFSALAIALAPATPMEFPRKLQRKAGSEEGQPEAAPRSPWVRGGGGGRGGPTPASQGTGKPTLVGHDARVEVVLS